MSVTAKPRMAGLPPEDVERLLAIVQLPPAAGHWPTNRSVRTASAAQVCHLFSGDTARSSCYGALLDPFRHALGLSQD